MLGAIVSFFTSNFLATKIILYALFVFVLPVVLHNLWVDLINEAIQYIFQKATVEGSTLATFTGLSAWFAIHLRLDEALTILLNIYIVRRIISLIKP